MSEAEKMAEEQTKQTEVAADAQVKVAEEQTKQAEIGARVAEQAAEAQVTQAEIVTAAAEPEPEASEEIERHEYVDVQRFEECQTRISALESQLEKLNQSLTRLVSAPTEAPHQASPSTPREETPASPVNRPEPPAPSAATKQEQEKPPAARRRAHRWI